MVSKHLLHHVKRFMTCKLPTPTFATIGELAKESQFRENVEIQGWVHRIQRYGKVLFLKITDGLSAQQIQAVVPRALISTITPGSAIRLRGKWLLSQGSEQSMEFLADHCQLMAKMEEQVPSGGNDSLRQIPHLRPKTSEFAAVLRLRSRLTHITHQFFMEKSFIHVDTPILSLNDCEGAGEAFNVHCPDEEFFNYTRPYLPVSAQLHLEAVSSAMTNVYTLSPAFRANPSGSRQHLAEFRMLEMECAFMDNLDHLCAIAEEFLRYIIQRVSTDEVIALDLNSLGQLSLQEGQSYDTQVLSKCLAGRIDEPLPRITFTDALRIIGISSDEKKRSLNKKDEMRLVNEFKGPVFVMHFPSQVKPFYMRRTDDGQFTHSFDLLSPFVGELAGGSVREWDPTLLQNRLPENADEKLDWYLDLRRWGYPRSAGFGLGMDRLMQSLFGIENIKDTIPFPRYFQQSIKC